MNLGRLVVVKNQATGLNRRSRQRIVEFHQVTYLSPHGKIDQILLTDQELETALTRSKANERTLLKITWLDRLAALRIRALEKILSLFRKLGRT